MRNVRKLVSYMLIFIGLMMLVPMSSGCSVETTSKENRFLELLTLLPATATADGAFALTNYELFLQANEISLFNSDDKEISTEEFIDILLSIAMDPKNRDSDEIRSWSTYYTGWIEFDISTIRDNYVGYSFHDIDAEINNFIRPYLDAEPSNRFNVEPVLKVAAIGKFNPDYTADALKNRDEWPSWARDHYTIEDYHDVTIHSWGDGSETHLRDRRSPPHLDQLGRACPLSVTDRYLFLGTSIQDVKTMIDSSQKRVASLADVPEYALLAKGMHDLAAYNIILGDESLANGYWENFDSYTGPFLKKFITFGTGYGRDERGMYIALTLFHGNPDKARDNAVLLEQRITTSSSEYFQAPWSVLIYDAEIYTEANVLLAKLYTNVSNLWEFWFLTSDTLLLHEE